MTSPATAEHFNEGNPDITGIKQSFETLEANAKQLYQALQTMPKEHLSLDEMRLVVDMMLELRKMLPPEDTIVMAGETAKKMPEFVNAEDTAAETLRGQITESVHEGKGFLSSLKDIFSSAFSILTKAVTTLLEILRNNPKILPIIGSAIAVGRSASSPVAFFNSIISGASENSMLIQVISRLSGISEKHTQTLLKDGIMAFIKEKFMDTAKDTAMEAANAVAPAVSTGIAARAGAAAGSAITSGSSSTALRVAGSILGRAGGVLGLLLPNDMGNGEIPKGTTPKVFTQTEEEKARIRNTTQQK